VDAAGNLFIADAWNACVRRVSPDGKITTVVGKGGQSGFSGDGGPATKAQFEEVDGLAIDAAGDLYVADPSGRIRKVSASGIISTVAGGGHPADGVGDNGPATAARLTGPGQIVVDPMGNLFIADWLGANKLGGRIRKVDTAGTITTVAGGGHPADGRGDGGPATDARFQVVGGVALDRAGNLYITDGNDNRVRKVGPDGTITTVVGGGQPADSLGDGGPATAARLNVPLYITLDAGGNLFIADTGNERIRKVDAAGIITTVAGSGQYGYSGDGGPATAARLNTPESVSVDGAGNLFFVEGNLYTAAGYEARPGNNTVREVIGVAVPG
jgi:sugar lactone lactonase YvrE